MYEKFADVELRTGQSMEVGVVLAPDLEYAEEVKKFLGHKPETYRWHIDCCVREVLDLLETRFYIGKVDGEIISNIMITEYDGIGTLGHVFTLPNQRRKGACKAIMGYQMDDFRHRGGKALYLGTGYDSHPYHIYKSFGFDSVYDGSGFMSYFATEDFDVNYFVDLDVHVKDNIEWHDWAKITALTGITNGDQIRSVALGIYGPSNFEGGFLSFKQELETGVDYHAAKLLQNASGAVVAMATVKQNEDIMLLDIFAHPLFWTQLGALLDSLGISSSKVQCYAETKSKEKIKLLHEFGFHCEGIQRDNDRNLDVAIYVSNAC